VSGPPVAVSGLHASLGAGAAGEVSDAPALAGVARGTRVAVVGASLRGTCGVRDHAVLLAEALEREGVSCSLRWLAREDTTLRAGWAQNRAWTRALADELRRSRPDAVLLHYSVFAYSHRGVPLFVRPTLAALHRAGVPLVVFGHELAFPWRRGGWRGAVWALTQRAELADLMRASTAVILTADFRVRWLTSRPWLPRRPVALAPVFSNLPPPAAARAAPLERGLIGLFGYAYDPGAIALVLDALALLVERGAEPRLTLLGAPGRDSPSAQAWLAAARQRRVEHALSFSGVLPAQDLSDALAGCEVMLFADAPGPSSRKTTLAAALASGRPLVAVDGPHRWAELVESEAARVVARTPRAVADAVAALLADEQEREVLGARGREFAARRMTVACTTEVVSALLGGVLEEPSAIRTHVLLA
jgi:glycosyltransferase involved in cell wall biosynthesis